MGGDAPGHPCELPSAAGLPRDANSYLKMVDDLYASDAYNSLSIEGYCVSAELIERDKGPRLHIDKPMLRAWREDFAEKMREPGVAANATPSVYRGRNKGGRRDAVYRAQRHVHSTAVRARVESIAKELQATGRIVDPKRSKLEETSRDVLTQWQTVADILDSQGEIVLGDVRYFAKNLPRVQTDRERLAVQLVEHMRSRTSRI